MKRKATAVIAAALAITLTSGVAVAATGDRDLRRLAGDSRYTTAVEISKEAFPNSASAVYLARADSYADALAGASLTDRGPILLVPQCGTVPAPVIAEANRLDPIEVVALGGSGAICDSVLQQFAGAVGDAPAGSDSVTITGGGGENSDPFVLAGGNYQVRYSYSTADCFYGAFLEPTNNDNATSHSLPSGDGPMSGDDNLYGVDPTEFFIRMISSAGCAWSITLTSR